MSDSPLLVKPVGNFLQPAKKGRGWAAQCADDSVLKFAPPATSDGTTYTLPATKPSVTGVLTSDNTGVQSWTAIGTSGAAIPLLDGTNTWSGQNTFSKSAVSGSAGLNITGSPFAGNGTTSLPVVYINNGSPVSSFHASGTMLAINGASGVGRLIDAHDNGGSSVFNVTPSGGVNATGDASFATVTTTGNINLAATQSIQWSGRGSLTSDSSSNVVCSAGLTIPNTSNLYLSNGTATGNYITSANTAVLSNNGTGQAAWNTHGFFIRKLILGYPNNDTFWTRPAAATSQLGDADAASPAAQTLSVQSVVAGTSNTSAVDWTQQGSLPTGTGTAGNQIIKQGFSGVIKSAVAATFTLANPCTVTVSNHGFVPGQPMTFATNGTLPTGLVAGTTYYVQSVTGVSSFRIATTPTGSAISTAAGSQSGSHTCTTSATVQSPAMTLATWGPSGLTAAQSTPALDITQNWNTTGTPYGIRLTIVNTAASASALALQINSGITQMFAVSTGGAVVANGNMTAGSTSVIGFAGLGTISSIATNQITIGPRDTTSAAAQKLRAQSVSSGGAAGANFSIVGSLGFGAFDSGNLLLKVGVRNGAVQATETTALTLAAETLAATFSGAITGQSTISTSDPTSGAGQAWKLGSVKAGVVALDTANYVEVMINGTIKKLLVAA